VKQEEGPDGFSVVGIELHRRRSVISCQDRDGQVLEDVRIDKKL
jgi:hypothetical protein